MLFERYEDYLCFQNLKPGKVRNTLKYLLIGRGSARPLYYMLETGNTCSLRCPFCFQGYYDPAVHSRKQLMRYEDFLVILGKIKDYALVFVADAGSFVVDDEIVTWDIPNRRWRNTEWHLESIFTSRVIDPRTATKADKPCPSLFNTLVLHANGASMICCHANRKGWEGPSLLEHSLEQIWNSQQYLRTREYALGKTRNRDAVFPQCRSCCWL